MASRSWARKRGIPFLLGLRALHSINVKNGPGRGLKEKILRAVLGICRPGSIFSKPISASLTFRTAKFFALRTRLTMRSFPKVRKKHAETQRMCELVSSCLTDTSFMWDGWWRQRASLNFSRLMPNWTNRRARSSDCFRGRRQGAIAVGKSCCTVALGRIRFVGFIQKQQLPAYYALCDALIFPTHSDPWGLVVNEAMASGSAIVTTDVAGCAADLVKDGDNGLSSQVRSVAPLRTRCRAWHRR
jgi:glycosyltransferase involved in cell wall biosynthesis